jgi:hypothetical protein
MSPVSAGVDPYPDAARSDASIVLPADAGYQRLRRMGAGVAQTRIMKGAVACCLILFAWGLTGYLDGREELATRQREKSYQAGIVEGRRLQAAADRNAACSTKEFFSRMPSKPTPPNLGAAQ